jgi:hypothetical protein
MPGDIPRDFDAKLADIPMRVPCAWCTPEERAAYRPCICTADLTRSVHECWREIASAAGLALWMEDGDGDIMGSHLYQSKPITVSYEYDDETLREWRVALGWETRDAD